MRRRTVLRSLLAVAVLPTVRPTIAAASPPVSRAELVDVLYRLSKEN